MGRLLAVARRAGSRAPMELLEDATLDEEAGVVGDSRGRSAGRQVTVLAREAWQEACDELGRELPWTTRRANLLVEGVDLPRQAGRRLGVGDALLEITGETEPCQRMDDAAPGLRRSLRPGWRGGVTCRVVTGGRVRPGDAVRVDPA